MYRKINKKILREMTVAAAALVAAQPSALAAIQDETPSDRGWLGILVDWSLECAWETEDRGSECEPVLKIEGVAEDGPSAEAGVTPGEMLLAINGKPMTQESYASLLEAIRPGVRLNLDLGRAEVRRYVWVTPGQRPADTESLPWRMVETAELATEVMVVPVKPLVDLEDGTVAFTFRTDDDGGLRIRPATIRIVGDRYSVETLDEEGVEIANLPKVLDVSELRQLSDSLRREYEAHFRELFRITTEYGLDTERLRETLKVMSPGSAPVLVGRTYAGAEFMTLSGNLEVRGTAKGLAVVRVEPGTPAYNIGLRRGDVVIEAGGRQATNLVDLGRAFELAETGQLVTVVWLRDGNRVTVTIDR